MHTHLTLARSLDVNGHVTIPLDVGHFLLLVFRTKPLSPPFLEILGPKDWVITLTFLGHVTSSVIVIGHVTTRFPVPHFLFVFHCEICDQGSISDSFYWAPNCISCAIVIAHARYHVTCTPYAKFGYIFEFPAPHCLFTMTLLLGSK